MTTPTPEPAEARQQAIEAEYGMYVAAVAIDFGGARAFNVGDPVPKSHVDRGVVTHDQVAKANTKAGEKAQAASVTNPVEVK